MSAVDEGAGRVAPVKGESLFCRVGEACAAPRRVAIPLEARDHFAEHFAHDFAQALDEARHDGVVAVPPAP